MADSSETRSAASSAAENDDDYDPPEALEAFCGKGVLTKELQAAGFSAVGIDYKGNKNKPVAKVVWLDLTQREDQLQFWEIIRTGKVRYVTLLIFSAFPKGGAQGCTVLRPPRGLLGFGG